MNKTIDSKKLIILVLLMVSIALNNSCTNGVDPPQPQPPEPVLLDVPIVTQDTFVWCWLAVSEMVIRYRNFGQSPRQCEIMEIGYSQPPGTCCSNLLNCTRTGGLDEIQRIIYYLGGSMSQLTPPNDPLTLYNSLDLGNPVIIAVQSGLGAGHVVVARGMRFERQFVQTPYGSYYEDVPMVIINDPMSFFPSEISYYQLRASWFASIIIY